MATTLPVNFEAPIAIDPKDDKGNPSAIENLRAESNSAAVSVLVEGNAVVVVPGGVAGETVQVTIKADARIGDGERELMDMHEFTLVGAEAFSLGSTVGALRPKAVRE